MTSPDLASLETRIAELPRDDQLLLVERLAHRLRGGGAAEAAGLDRELSTMAADPEIQRELCAIREECSLTEADGLEGL